MYVIDLDVIFAAEILCMVISNTSVVQLFLEERVVLDLIIVCTHLWSTRSCYSPCNCSSKRAMR